MTSYKYDVVTIEAWTRTRHDKKLKYLLNTASHAGWEVVSIRDKPLAFFTTSTVIFRKR